MNAPNQALQRTDPGRSPKQQTTFTTMEVFGMLGFSFGMMAFAITASLQSEVKKLRKEVDELKQKLPHS
jgi:hypothetical protein